MKTSILPKQSNQRMRQIYWNWMPTSKSISRRQWPSSEWQPDDRNLRRRPWDSDLLRGGPHLYSEGMQSIHFQCNIADELMDGIMSSSSLMTASFSGAWSTLLATSRMIWRERIHTTRPSQWTLPSLVRLTAVPWNINLTRTHYFEYRCTYS